MQGRTSSGSASENGYATAAAAFRKSRCMGITISRVDCENTIGIAAHGTATHRGTNAVRSEGEEARRSLAQGDQGGERQAMHRRRQHRPDDIDKERKRWHTRETLGAICTARAVAGIVLRAGVFVLVVIGCGGSSIRLCRVAGMHARRTRRRCGRHRQRLHHRRTGKRQCKNQGKCDAWQGHARNSSIVIRGRQTVRFA